MAFSSSAVLSVPAASPQASVAFLTAHLSHYTDAWDLAQDLSHPHPHLVVVDARSAAAFALGHIPGAVSLPHRTLTADVAATLDRAAVYVTYCDGVGCNASTKGALKLAAMGFQVKEFMGGLDWWKRDGYEVAKEGK